MVTGGLVDQAVLEDDQEGFAVAGGQLRVEDFQEGGCSQDAVLFDIGGQLLLGEVLVDSVVEGFGEDSKLGNKLAIDISQSHNKVTNHSETHAHHTQVLVVNGRFKHLADVFRCSVEFGDTLALGGPEQPAHDHERV